MISACSQLPAIFNTQSCDTLSPCRNSMTSARVFSLSENASSNCLLSLSCRFVRSFSSSSTALSYFAFASATLFWAVSIFSSNVTTRLAIFLSSLPVSLYFHLLIRSFLKRLCLDPRQVCTDRSRLFLHVGCCETKCFQDRFLSGSNCVIQTVFIVCTL